MAPQGRGRSQTEAHRLSIPPKGNRTKSYWSAKQAKRRRNAEWANAFSPISQGAAASGLPSQKPPTKGGLRPYSPCIGTKTHLHGPRAPRLGTTLPPLPLFEEGQVSEPRPSTTSTTSSSSASSEYSKPSTRDVLAIERALPRCGLDQPLVPSWDGTTRQPREGGGAGGPRKASECPQIARSPRIGCQRARNLLGANSACHITQRVATLQCVGHYWPLDDGPGTHVPWEWKHPRTWVAQLVERRTRNA